MKAQGMPIRTIAVVILAIIVMAVIIIWYLMYTGKITSATWDFLNLGEKKEQEVFDCTGGKECPPGYQCCMPSAVCVPVTEACPT